MVIGWVIKEESKSVLGWFSHQKLGVRAHVVSYKFSFTLLRLMFLIVCLSIVSTDHLSVSIFLSLLSISIYLSKYILSYKLPQPTVDIQALNTQVHNIG